MDQLPPNDRKWGLLAEKAVDLSAIVALAIMGLHETLDPSLAASLIALIAGVNLGQILNRTRGGSSGFIIGLADMLLSHHKGGV